MKLSISNIAWKKEEDEKMYSILRDNGFSGLEIAPTRIFDNPYFRLKDAERWSEELKLKYGIKISSIQSIWYGRKEQIFESTRDRDILKEYTKKAINFASKIGCKNIVFGCPKNRCIGKDFSEKIAVDFFKEISDYAYGKNTCLALEANPEIYGTDFINDTFSAIDFVKKVDSKGFKLNLDIGTIIENNEDVNGLKGYVKYINHVHISEPYLNCIKKRNLHKLIKKILSDERYCGYVSIEMKSSEVNEITQILKYVADIFGN